MSINTRLEWYLYLPGVCLRSASSGPWPQRLIVSQILVVLNINLVNKCSVLVYIYIYYIYIYIYIYIYTLIKTLCYA